MYYVIEAVRWASDGHISHVRWHAVDAVEADDATIVHTASEIVPAVDAAKACGSSEVRVYVEGDLGHFFKLKACPEGVDAEADTQGTPLRERMAHLPSF